MEISIPLFILGYKIKPWDKDIVKRHIAIEIILELLIGKSSSTYHKLYDEGLLLAELDLEYEFEKSYAYIALRRTEPKSR